MSPYDVKAVFRIAVAYKDICKLDDAVKYIKRIVIWPSTDDKVKKLYKELVNSDPKAEEEKEVLLILIIEN